jgi:hypothetical protein
MSLRFLDQSLPPRMLRGAILVAVAAMLAACGTNTPAASSAAEPSAPVSVAPEPSTEVSSAAEPSESAAPSEAAEAPCLPADLFAALQAIESVEVGPDLPAAELADAVEALDLSEFDTRTQVMQDDLVSLLRAGEASSFDAQVAAGVLRQTTGMTEC